jgi:hypothetical protein
LFSVLEKDHSHLQVSVTGNPSYWLDVTSGSKSPKKPIFVSKQPPEYRLVSPHLPTLVSPVAVIHGAMTWS